ncbi:MAG: phosphoribosyltransferase family protein [Candidatus Nitrosocaldaceae archaeon]
MNIRFKDRIDAGLQLASRLEYLKDDLLILSIPRGGVVVGDVIAKRLNAELDVICPRKLGALNNPELAIGAIMHDGTFILNNDIIRFLSIPESYIREEMERKKNESLNRVMKFRGNSIYNLESKSIILVDDGVATGATALVAAKWLRKYPLKRLIIAIPVGPPDTLNRLKEYGDVISVLMPYDFSAVGEFYDDFSEVTDDMVLSILKG